MKFPRPINRNMLRKERLTLYFNSLFDAMNTEYDWTNSRDGSNRSSYRFQARANSGEFWNLLLGVCSYRAWFPQGDTEVVAGLHIRESQVLLDALHELKAEIECDFGYTLDWSQRLCRNPGRQKRKFIFASRGGSIHSPEHELLEIGEWHIETLLKLDEVFTPRIQRLRSEIVL